MPNWCEHDLIVNGPLEERARFLAAITVSLDELKAEQAKEREATLAFYAEHQKRIEAQKLLAAPDAEPVPQTQLMVIPDPDPEPTEVAYRILSKLLPIPPELVGSVSPPRDAETAKELIAKTGFPDWYSWQSANWGIKWGDCRTRLVSESKRGLTFWFETPWAPAVPAYERIAAMFPGLTFTYRYYEQGMCFQGTLRYRKGKCTLSYESEYSGDRGG